MGDSKTSFLDRNMYTSVCHGKDQYGLCISLF